MKRGIRYIEWLSSSMLILLLMTGCASSSYEEGEELPQEKPVLKIYLFAPDSPIVTRSEIGKVDATDEEKSINTLDVWAFKANTDDLVGYIHLSNQTFDGQKEIAMEISDDFATNPTNIDIYVTANVMISNCGLNLGRNVTQADLTSAIIAHKTEGDFFGVTTPVMSVPVEGLPMSGLLKNQPVTGSAPVLAAKTRNVQLVRAVSKVRFIFSKSASNTSAITNLSIKLHEGVLPKQEYLFLNGPYDEVSNYINIKAEGGYNAEAILVEGKTADDINSCDDPASYTYTSETGQAYETKINEGLKIQDGQTSADLSELGRFYLRESDRFYYTDPLDASKKITGTISYKVGDDEKSANFTIAGDNDFTRNHTWIVYGYFLGSGTLMLNIVDVKAWTESSGNPKVHNW